MKYNLYVYVYIAILLFLIIFSFVDLYNIEYYPKPGTENLRKFAANISEIGFGPKKQLIIFEFDVSTIDMSDKKFMTMHWSSTSGQGTHTAGIEIKGSGLDQRTKLNYNFEIWSPKDDNIACTSPETCDDDKAELFDFNEDYEDYVLRGGFQDPLLFRDSVASQLKGGLLEHTLVEVVFKNGGDYYYEGVYILYPAIQRRFLEKKLDWDTKGKKTDCDENPSAEDIEETAFIAEYTNPTNRKKDCDWISNIKMRYPKCDIGTCYHETIQRYISVVTGKNTSYVPLNLISFVETFFAEELLLSGDFPLSSQYFYKDPSGTVNSGPRWDFDYGIWRIKDWYSWDIDTGNIQKPAKLWVNLGKHMPFITLLKEHKEITVEYNLNKSLEVLAERENQFKLGYFDRNMKRWDTFGKKISSYATNMYLLYPGSRSKKTWQKEITYTRDFINKRSKWMLENENDEFRFLTGVFAVSALIQYVPVIFILILACLGCVFYLGTKRKNKYKLLI